jgi:hypothetical protein
LATIHTLKCRTITIISPFNLPPIFVIYCQKMQPECYPLMFFKAIELAIFQIPFLTKIHLSFLELSYMTNTS